MQRDFSLGNPEEALWLYRELLLDQERVLGKDHPSSLLTRSNIAICTGAVGDVAGELRLLQQLLADLERVLGREYRHTLDTRGQIARCIGESGDVAGALRLYRELLSDTTTNKARGVRAAWALLFREDEPGRKAGLFHAQTERLAAQRGRRYAR